MENNLQFGTLHSWIMLATFVIAVALLLVAVARNVKGKKNNKFFGAYLVFLAISLMSMVGIKYDIKNYVEKDGYSFLVGKRGLFETRYEEEDYREYWVNLKSYTYRIDHDAKTV